MSSGGSVTPRRRHREEDGSWDSEPTVSDNAISSPAGKRRRVDREPVVDENAEAEAPRSRRAVGSVQVMEPDRPDRPLFPDNYRRSPKSKERAHNNHIPSEHHAGSIVRVTLQNFVTYTSAEFHPGPSLNMVIGPNGTGKSTLVCAICIGLGWNPSHLGRAKDVTEFIKHGSRRAQIEIELKADPARHRSNPTIALVINRDSGSSKSTFSIDGKKCSNKAVQELARSYSIQVDNLCQFLPQDRVVEFAALSPIDLLSQTQRAAAPEHMSQWHEELKRTGKEQKQRAVDQQRLMDDLKALEERQRSEEGMVQRLRERNALQWRLATLEKFRPYCEYGAALDQYRQAKEQRKAASRELRDLEARAQPNQEAIDFKKEYCDRLNALVENARTRILNRLEQMADESLQAYDKTATEIRDCESLLATEKSKGKDDRVAISRYQVAIRSIENMMQNPPAPYDAKPFNDAIKSKNAQIRDKDGEQKTITDEMSGLEKQMAQCDNSIEKAETSKIHMRSQAGQQESKLGRLSTNAVKAWKWIQANRRLFSGPVFGPPLITCTVKDPRQINAVEAAIGLGELSSFTVTCQEDFKLLQEQLIGRLSLPNVSVRSSLQPLASFRPPCSQEELRRLGGEAWMLDLVDGPDEVLAMLCDNRNLNGVAYTSGDISNTQFRALEESTVSAFLTKTQHFVITRRREYGASGTGTRTLVVKPAQYLTDAPVDSQAEREKNREINELKMDKESMQTEYQNLQSRFDILKHEKNKLIMERDEIKQDLKAKQEQKSSFDGLATRRDGLQEKLADVRSSIQEQSQRMMDAVNDIDRLVQEKGQKALDYASLVESLRSLHLQLFEMEIKHIEAKSDLDQLKTRYEEELERLQQRRIDVESLKQTEHQMKEIANQLQETCEALHQSLDEAEEEIWQESDNAGWQAERLETDIQQVMAQLDMLYGGNENMIKLFEERAQKINDGRSRLGRLERTIDEVTARITQIREQWEPQLDQLVSQISDAFAENFTRIQCAGEVAVHKDDDFDQWAIQIKVKFRENEPLSILDSHRQSGGERAVSTIFYLMALQSLARAPFRVVDEINQGMDPRNERLVHSRMVEIACAEHTSQYFLITPKLLNNLTYHPNMKVHCIASGEYMPAEHRELNFEMLAKKALAVRAAAAA